MGLPAKAMEPSQELIIDTIGHYRKTSEALNFELNAWVMELIKIKNSKLEFDDCIRAAAIPGLDDLGKRIKRFKPEEVIEEARKILMDQIRYTSDRADTTRKRIREMNRIMICFEDIPYQERVVLEEVYRDGVSLKEGKFNAMARTGITSERHIRRIRNQGIESIKRLYNQYFIKGEYFEKEYEYEATA